ncbi:MAG TPA: penicillin-binding protein activator, partial [Myxococcaceae bacterium]|nr:penicillin-binding protein activator [Myxococcaceae bacterium]
MRAKLMTRSRFRPLVPLFAFIATFGCTPKTSSAALPRVEQSTAEESPRPRIEALPDAQADAALARAEGTAAGPGPKAKAAEAYLGVRKSFPNSTAGQEALYRAGLLYFEANDFANARRAFNELLFENPTFNKAADARLKLGMSALQTGAYRDAYQSLSSLAENATGDERTRLLELSSRAAEGALLSGEALRIAVKLAAAARSEDEQKQRLQRVTDIVEGRANLAEVAQVAEETAPTDPSWPILTFKLARIYYHLRDWPKLEAALQRFLSQAPNHPYASDAQELLARANRRAKVNPKAIGVILPMSGRYKPIGDAVMRGLKLALEGSDLQLVVKDSQGDANVAGRAVEELTYDDGVMAVVGPVLAEDARRAAVVAEEVQVPILTLTKSEGITQIGPHVFRNMLTNTAQAQALAEYGTKVMGYKNFAVLYPNS